MADLIVDSHIVAAFRNRINAVDAISEFIDNSLAANATHFEFRFEKDRIVVTDNGDGIQDLNLLTKLGGSYAGPETINVYGIGAKEAALHYGSLIDIQSVCKGKFRRYELDWDKVQQNGTPKLHDKRNVLPISGAPKFIKSKGTVITIKRLSAGRSRIYPDAIIKRLSHRYRPALLKGKAIHIWFADGNFKPLSPTADVLGLWKNEKEIMGIAADKSFALRYTDLKEYDRNLTGIHIAYGDRFIEHITSLNGKALPPLLYAEVTLTSRWRECLSPNKTALVKFHDELEAAVYGLIKDWIKELEAFADEARIERLNVLLQKHTADIFIFKSGEGANRKRRKVVVTTPIVPGPGPRPQPDPHEKKYDVICDEHAKGDKEKRKRRPGGLLFKRDNSLGNMPFVIAPDLNTNQLTIVLNGSIPAIDTAYQVPYKIPALWPLISAAFAGWVRENIAKIDIWLPDLFNILHSEGYEIDPESPVDAELYLLTWMLRQHPPTVKELEAREVA